MHAEPGASLAALDRLAALAARLLNVAVAVVHLADEDHPAGRGRYALALRSAEARAIVARLENPLHLANPALAGELFAFHATEPLALEGRRLGAIYVMDGRPRVLDATARETLHDLADAVVEHAHADRMVRRLGRAEAALRAITQGTAGTIGDSFFRSLVTQLTQVLDVPMAFIAEVLGPAADRARVLAFCSDGTVLEGAEFALAGTPCEDVLAGRICALASGVREAYPDDHMLVDLGIESYVGTQLCCTQGGRVGWMAVMDRRPIADVALVESIVRLFALRAGAELDRRRAEGVRRRAHDDLEARVVERTRELRLSEEKFSKAFRSSPHPMAIVVAGSGRVMEANDAFLFWTGYRQDEVVGRTALELNLWVDPEERARMLARLRAEGQVRNFELEYRRKDGERRLAMLAAELLDIRGEECILAVVHDVTSAFHDELTGLPNRALFLDRLGRTLERGRRRGEHTFAVLFLDVDRFKTVNDSLGHTAGDRLLGAIGRTLSITVRPHDTVARLGGDEFAILVEELSDAGEATRVAERLLHALALPLDLNGQQVFPTASIGIALSSTGYTSPEDVVRDADTAMYRAKARGKARYEVFDQAMHAHAVSQLRLETELRQAIERQEFRVEYQPIVALEDGRIVGLEALVRWHHPTRGIVYPAEFLQTAEETGLIVPLGWWVVREACRQVAEWQTRFTHDLPWVVAVNLSSRQFSQPNMVEEIEALLRETGVNPAHLMLEITEHVLMESSDVVTERLARLRDLRIKLSLDDFGTGYSSLSYLHRFPIHTLKIDRSFVGQMGAAGQNVEIVRSIVTLAHNLSKDVIAEGVETQEQLARLRELGCDYVQGFLVSPTIDAPAAAAWLAGPRAGAAVTA